MGQHYYVRKRSGGGYVVTDDPTAYVGGEAASLALGVGGLLVGGLVALNSGVDNWIARLNNEAEVRHHAVAFRDLEKSAAGDSGQAYLAAAAFVDRYPEDPRGYATLANAAVGLGRPEDALDAVDRASEKRVVSKAGAAALRLPAFIALEDMRSALEEAQVLCDAGERPAWRFGLLARAQILLWLGDLDQALRDVSAALGEEPSDRAYELRGDVSWARGDLDGAAGDYRIAVRLGADSAAVAKYNAVKLASGHPESVLDPTKFMPRAKATPPVRKRTAIVVRRVLQMGGGGSKYKFWFDGERRSDLAGGAVDTIQTQAGEHELRVGWGPMQSGPLTIDLADMETVEVECGEVKGSFGLGKLVIRRTGSEGAPFKP